MSAETECYSEVEIPHVLFIDTVGYSKLLLNEQRRVLETLKKIVPATRSFQAPNLPAVSALSLATYLMRQRKHAGALLGKIAADIR